MGVGRSYNRIRVGTSCRTTENCSPSYTSSTPLPNPNPANFRITKQYQVKDIVVVTVKYPDCTNYEGLKIMVYRAQLNDVLAQDKLDPHFCNGKHLSPLARFVPTEEGWKMAIAFAQTIAK